MNCRRLEQDLRKKLEIGLIHLDSLGLSAILKQPGHEGRKERPFNMSKQKGRRKTSPSLLSILRILCLFAAIFAHRIFHAVHQTQSIP
jgi:hypothetical protein